MLAMGQHVVSVDEKTGIQALERVRATLEMKSGHVEKQEFEYIRHGTQSLIASFSVASGEIIFASMQKTRKEEDFVEHIKGSVKTDPNGRWVFVVDQLNTHKSASLV